LVVNSELMPLMEINDVISFLGKELNTKLKSLVMNKYVSCNSDAEVIKLFNNYLLIVRLSFLRQSLYH